MPVVTGGRAGLELPFGDAHLGIVHPGHRIRFFHRTLQFVLDQAIAASKRSMTAGNRSLSLAWIASTSTVKISRSFITTLPSITAVRTSRPTIVFAAANRGS